MVCECLTAIIIAYIVSSYVHDAIVYRANTWKDIEKRKIDEEQNKRLAMYRHDEEDL
jgi:hypothetical protein